MSGAAAGVPRASPSRVDERLIAMYGSVNMAASALATVKMPDVYRCAVAKERQIWGGR